MFSRVDIGDLENLGNFLPSWISEPLGEKLYMIDEVNQLPSSPPKESPLRDDSSNHKEDPEMNTSSPLEKEINVMTQGGLGRMREVYSFPAGIQAKIPEEGETILSTRPSEVAFYEVVFPVGLRFPIHPTIKRILNFYNICPAQLSHNVWRSVVYVLVIWRFYKHHLSLNEFRSLYTLFKRQKPNSV